MSLVQVLPQIPAMAHDACGADESGLTDAKPGRVTLVGAGPGDPELLTIKAVKALQSAQVVFYDTLVTTEIMAHVHSAATCISVGKAPGNHTVSQPDIHAMMYHYARAGHHVVRLKGGDPFLFARGGEEIAALQHAGIPVDVIPGVSAAFGCAAAAGIPLSHRDHAQAVTFITGHGKDNRDHDLDWAHLAHPGHTLVIYMGLRTASKIAAHLITAGLADTTPVALIENGTRQNQRIIRSTLDHMVHSIKAAHMTSPTLIIIGDVVAASQNMDLYTIAQQMPERALAI